MSIISCTSPSPSAMILPDSSVTSWPSSGFSSRRAIPSLFRTDCIRHRLALRAEQVDRFVDHLGRNVERGSKTNRAVAGFQDEQAAIKKSLPEFVARFRIWQIEGDEEAASADSGDDRLAGLQPL